MITKHNIYDNVTKDDWKFSTWSQVCVFMRKICHSQIPQTCNNLDHVRLLKSYRPLLKAQFWKPFTQTHFFSLRVTSNLASRLSSFISHVHFSWYLILSICIFQWHSTLFRGCKLNSCIPLFLILVYKRKCLLFCRLILALPNLLVMLSTLAGFGRSNPAIQGDSEAFVPCLARLI